jgi:phage gpG-like protein
VIRFLGRWLGIEGIAEEEMKALRKPAERAVMKAALRFERGIKTKLSNAEPRTGRMYGTHQASAPGEPPALKDGTLRRSITHTFPTWDEDNRVSAEVGTALVYARILEWGGVAGNGARILPRPYIESTFFEMREELEAILAEAIE